MNDIWFKVKYYRLIPLVLLGLCLYLCRDYIYIGYLKLSLNPYSTDISKSEKTLLDYSMMALWAWITFTTLRDKRYRFLTGRFYQKDHVAFKKGYFQLTHFFTHNDPYKMDIKKLPVEDWHESDGVILCKYRDKMGKSRLVKRESYDNGNIITFGLPGSGKSTAQAAPTALRFNTDLVAGGCGVFAISIKGDLLNFLKNKRKNIKIFTPDQAEGSCHYNPLDGLAKMTPTDRRTFVENLSIIICPDEEGENASYFVNGARDYFCAVTHYLLFLHDTGAKEGELRFAEIVDTILLGNVFDTTLTIKDSDCYIAGEYSNSYQGSSEKNVAGIWNHLCKSVRPFNTGALRTLLDGEGDCITPADLDTGDVIIDVPQDKYLLYQPIMAILTTNFLTAFMRRVDVSSNKKVVPIIFLLDEVIQLHLDFKILSQAMATLRSKKVTLFLLCQSIAQIEGQYGEVHARELIDLCQYISVFNAQDPKSREFFQKLVGRRKMLKVSTSRSMNSSNKVDSSGTNVSVEDEYIFEAADFGDLSKRSKSGNQIPKVLIYGNGRYILGDPTPCYK